MAWRKWKEEEEAGNSEIIQNWGTTSGQPISNPWVKKSICIRTKG